jgi:RNA polymerase sigma-70 factor, ECF subfamily
LIKSASDQDLVKRLARGDHHAFDEIYDRCRMPVFRFALHMSGSREIADEVTQDAFLFLLHKPAVFSEERGALAGFLIGVARNLVRRTLRAADDGVSLEEEGVESMITETAVSNSPLDLVMRQQSAGTLQAALLEIPQLYREVVVLCDLQEMSYAETALILSIPLGTVRSRLHRGHGALLDVLSRGRCAENSGSKRSGSNR